MLMSFSFGSASFTNELLRSIPERSSQRATLRQCVFYEWTKGMFLTLYIGDVVYKVVISQMSI